MNYLNPLFRCAIALATLVSLAGAGEKGAPVRVLDTAGEGVKKQEVRHSMIGPRDTLVFYTFEKQNAVLRVGVDNKSKKFPVTATVYLFAKDVTAEGLAKWLNNQHSDGLFPEVPEPVATHKIAEKSCATKSHELIDRSKQHGGEFDNYCVKFHIGEVAEKGAFKLKAFTGETKVFVKVP